MKYYIDFSESGYATLTETAQHWNFSLTGEMADYVRGYMNEKGVVLRDAIDGFLDNEVETFQLIKSEMNSKVVTQIVGEAITKLYDTEFSGRAITFPEFRSVPWHTLRAIKLAFRDSKVNLIPSVINSPKAAIRIETFALWMHTLIRVHNEDNLNFRKFFEFKIKYIELLHKETLALI